MRCDHCHHDAPSLARFCPVCGTQLSPTQADGAPQGGTSVREPVSVDGFAQAEASLTPKTPELPRVRRGLLPLFAPWVVVALAYAVTAAAAATYYVKPSEGVPDEIGRLTGAAVVGTIVLLIVREGLHFFCRFVCRINTSRFPRIVWLFALAAVWHSLKTAPDQITQGLAARRQLRNTAEIATDFLNDVPVKKPSDAEKGTIDGVLRQFVASLSEDRAELDRIEPQLDVSRMLSRNVLSDKAQLGSQIALVTAYDEALTKFQAKLDLRITEFKNAVQALDIPVASKQACLAKLNTADASKMARVAHHYAACLRALLTFCTEKQSEITFVGTHPKFQTQQDVETYTRLLQAVVDASEAISGRIQAAEDGMRRLIADDPAGQSPHLPDRRK